MSPLVAAASQGDRRKALEAIRDRVARELTDAEGRDVAALSRELRAVLAELDALPDGKEISDVDEVAAKRAARRQAAAGL